MSDKTHLAGSKAEEEIARREARYGIEIEDSDEQTKLIDIDQIRAVIWRQRHIVIFTTISALILGLCITLLMVPKYQASATVRIDPNSVSVFDGQDLEPGVDWRFLDRYANTLTGVLTSRRLAEKVTDKLDLARNDAFFEGMGVELEDEPSAAAAKLKMRRSLATALLSSTVSMQPDQNSNIASVVFTAEDPQLAALIANAYAEAFVTDNATRQADTNAYAINLIQEQIQETREQLATSERGTLAYTRQNQLLAAPANSDSSENDLTGGSLAASNLTATNQQYIEARNRRILAEQRWNSAKKGNALELPEVRDNLTIQDLLSQQARLRGDLAELRGRYLPDHPEIVEKERQLAALESEIKNTSSSLRNSIRREYEVSLDQEKQLESERDRLAGVTMDEQARRVQLGILSRETDALRYRLSKLLDRQGELESASDAAPTNIQILDRALPSGAPYSPNMLKNMGVALVLGIGLAVGLAFLREILDDAIYSPDLAERKLNLRLLGVTPYETEAMAFKDMHSGLGEAYGSLRVALDFATGGKVHKSILVTSSRPSEGKTTTARMLAEEFAHTGRRVLLVDADLRNPSVHREFDARNDRGLTNIIVQDEPLFDNLMAKTLPMLDVLTAGKTQENPSHILSSEVMHRFLNNASRDYDLIIIDSPPVMGLADAPMISRVADYTLIVVEAGRANYSGARRAIKRLKDSGAKLVGMVVTKFDYKQAGYGYEYGYQNYRYDAVVEHK